MFNAIKGGGKVSYFLQILEIVSQFTLNTPANNQIFVFQKSPPNFIYNF